MRIGDSIQIKACNSGGVCYRSWYSSVEAIEDDKVVVISLAGQPVQDLDRTWVSEHTIRGYYWLDRMYGLLEVYTADGTLEEIYVNISSPVHVEETHLWFTDYELDVSHKLPHPAQIVDEDEF